MRFAITDKMTPEMATLAQEKYQNPFLTEVFLHNRYTGQGINLFFFNDYDEGNRLRDVIVFYLQEKSVTVANRLVEIDLRLASKFQDAIFREYPRINRIVWPMMLNKILLRNSFSYLDNHDMCIVLPGSKEEYDHMLSTNSRKIYANKTNRVKRDLEGIFIDETASAENEFMVDRLSEWKQAQMAQRGEKSKIVPEVMRNVFMKIGSVSYVMDKGDVACVCLFYKVGRHVYLEQTAYDEKYSRYSLGRVTLYQSIIHFIDRGMTHFHFLWKGADYKKHYSACEVPAYTTMSYRGKSACYAADYARVKTRLFLRKLANTPWGHALRQWINKRLHGRTI